MQLWKLVFHPREGERNSPIDRMAERDCTAKDRANIMAKLEALQEMQRHNWPLKWAKPIEEFLELKHGDFRVFYELIGDTIVVCHVCRKISQKARPADIATARASLADYKSEEEDE